MSQKSEKVRKEKSKKKSSKMSPSKKARHQDYVWQHDKSNIAQRDSYLLDNELYTDCSFIVGRGDKQRTFKCHRAHLARSSPVFEAMLFGEFSKNQLHDIIVPDVEPDTFHALLKYLYSGIVAFTNVQIAFDLLYAAKKYLLPPPFLQDCRGYIWINIGRNVWSTLQFAERNDEQDLYKCAWQIVKVNTSKLLVDANFVYMPQHILIQLLKEDTLKCTELDLYQACIRWARHQKVLLIPTVRQNFECFLPHIRFLSMSVDELSRCLRYDKMLTGDESTKLFMKISLPEGTDVSIPHNFCANNTKRSPCCETFSVLASSPLIMPFKELTWPDCSNVLPYFSRELVSVIFNKPTELISIDLPTQIQPVNSISKTYREGVTLLLVDISSQKILCASRLAAEVDYNSIANFTLRHPVPMKMGLQKIIFTIFFHVSGDYPVLKNRAYTDAFKLNNSSPCTGTLFTFQVFIKSATFSVPNN